MAAKKPKPAMTGARARQLAANPATRAALADKFLSPAQLKQRQLNQRLDTPVTPGSTLTNRQLAQQRNAAVQVQYGPQDQALGSRSGGVAADREGPGRLVPGLSERACAAQEERG
jgi:hypothetical protein